MSRLALLFACFITAPGPAHLWAQDSGDLIFTARRSDASEILDAVTLQTVARVHFNFRLERAWASAGGSKLKVAGYVPDLACCKQYSLDPATLKLAEDAPASDRSGYGPQLISVDGRWCVQLKSFRGPAAKVTDLRTGAVRLLTPPDLPAEDSSGNWSATGVWSGSRFYLYVQRPDSPGFLWTVSPGAETLGAGVAVAAFGEMSACRSRLPVAKSIAAWGGNIYLYEPFGGKADRTHMCGAPVPGGAWMVDTASGKLVKQIAPGLHFGSLVPDSSAAMVYGVALGDSEWNGPVDLVRLNGQDGTVMQTRMFDPGILQIGVGRLAAVPKGEVFGSR